MSALPDFWPAVAARLIVRPHQRPEGGIGHNDAEDQSGGDAVKQMVATIAAS
jgi:hypothetical protein